MAAVLPWYFRRRLHPDPAVQAATPRQLVFVLPMRVLVEQIAGDPFGALAIGLAFGLALMAIVTALGHLSGDHLGDLRIRRPVLAQIAGVAEEHGGRRAGHHGRGGGGGVPIDAALPLILEVGALRSTIVGCEGRSATSSSELMSTG